jgi:nucleoside-diphosphate-sugar epimerase
MKICLPGASGFVGSHLVQSLIAVGHELVAHYRLPQLLNSKSQHNLEVWSGDLNDVPSLSKQLQGIDSVIHCAAEMKLWNSKKALHETNVLMTKNILKATKQAGVSQFIFTSRHSELQCSTTAGTRSWRSCPRRHERPRVSLRSLAGLELSWRHRSPH